MAKLKTIIFVVGVMLLILAAVWCVIGGVKRRTGQT